ncbi:AEC family transporter [Sphingomonas sp. M1-B02]|uniref:AEC family transporter n=1 Tax=Sphingomonas sp. M1-B02 TaxID=3114300 RepID=UPI00223FF53F|nr:AEC family transporter [Sphingomonas sp. S6-11]UZK66306.1 AEC family transporter [Sphingomonas sp. S6-11]
MVEIIGHALVPIFFVIALGYIGGLRGRIDNHHVGELNTLVMDYALPASLFVATATTPWAKMRGEESIVVLLAIGMMLPYAAWYLIARWRGVTRQESAIGALTVGLPNYAAAGLPIIQAVVGTAGTVHVAVAIAAGSILPSPVTLLILELNKPSEGMTTSQKLTQAIWRAFTKRIVLAPVAGTLLSASGVDLGPLLTSSLQLIGVSAGGVALFLTGLVLSSQPFKLNPVVAGGTIVANLLQPAFVWALTLVLMVPADQARIAILLAAMPSGFFGILFGINYKAVSDDVGSTVIASTVLSLLTLGFVIYWFFPS